MFSGNFHKKLPLSYHNLYLPPPPRPLSYLRIVFLTEERNSNISTINHQDCKTLNNYIFTYIFVDFQGLLNFGTLTTLFFIFVQVVVVIITVDAKSTPSLSLGLYFLDFQDKSERGAFICSKKCSKKL